MVGILHLHSDWLMLLFVKGHFLHALRNGSKTLEIRAGSRYARIRPGHVLAVNGRQLRLRVGQVERFEGLGELLESLATRHRAVGFDSMAELCAALRICYPKELPPYIVLHVTPL